MAALHRRGPVFIIKIDPWSGSAACLCTLPAVKGAVMPTNKVIDQFQQGIKANLRVAYRGILPNIASTIFFTSEI